MLETAQQLILGEGFHRGDVAVDQIQRRPIQAGVLLHVVFHIRVVVLLLAPVGIHCFEDGVGLLVQDLAHGGQGGAVDGVFALYA